MKLLLILALSLLSGCIVVPQTVDGNPDLPFIELEGYRFHAETLGSADKPVAIVLHGGPGADSRYLQEASTLLSEHFHVVVYDQRGTGLSPRVPAEQITVDSFIHDLDLFVDKFSPNQPVRLVGHSWGAMLATAYTSEHPDKVSHIVLAEPQFLDPSTANSMMSGFPGWRVIFGASSAWINKWRVASRGDPYARDDYFILQMLQIMQMPAELCDGQLPELSANRFGSPVFQATIGKMMADEAFAASLTFVDGIENYNGKTLLLTGACNTLYGAEYQSKHMGFFRQVRMATIEDAGHFMFNDQPEKAVNLVVDFLNE